MSLVRIIVFLFSFGSLGGAGGDIDIDIRGNIYVVDRANNQIVCYTPTGDSIRGVTGYGTGELQFDEPVAVVARNGIDIYVADHNNHRVQRFNRTLDYITTIRTRNDPDERKRFGYPRDIAINRQGELLVVDGENHRIIRITPDGRVTGTFGDIEAGDGRLADPERIEVDGSDNIYVLDGGNIFLYDPFGSYRGRVDLGDDSGISSISIDGDTLLVGTPDHISLYSLPTHSLPTFDRIGVCEIATGATAYCRTNTIIMAVEPKRVAVYRWDTR